MGSAAVPYIGAVGLPKTIGLRFPPTRGRLVVAEGDKAYGRALREALVAVSADADEVVLTSDGAAVKKLLTRSAAEPPAALLLDLWLPRWPGLEILRWIREDVRLRAMPVVMLSVGADPILRARAYELGANSFAVKPYAPRILARNVALMAAYWRHVNLPPVC